MLERVPTGRGGTRGGGIFRQNFDIPSRFRDMRVLTWGGPTVTGRDRGNRGKGGNLSLGGTDGVLEARVR